VLPGI